MPTMRNGSLVRALLATAAALSAPSFGCGHKDEPARQDGSNAAQDPAREEPGHVIGTAVRGRWIVVHSGLVYSSAENAVWSQLKRGDDWQMTQTTGLGPDGTFVVANRSIYWVATPTGALVKTPELGQGDAYLVADPKATRAGRVVVDDGTNAFWRADGHLVSVPLSGGSLRTLAEADDDGPLLVAGGAVFFTKQGDIRRVDPDGSNSASVAKDQRGVRFLAGDAKHLYWLTTDGALRAATLGGGETKDLASGLAAATGLTVGPDGVYVSSGTSISRIPLAGGASEIVVAKAGSPTAPVYDSGDLLWIDTKQNLVYKRSLGN